VESVKLAGQRYFEYLELVASRGRGIVAIHSFIPPFHAETGVAGAWAEGDITTELADLNLRIRRFSRQNAGRIALIDFERIARLLGESGTIDYRFWAMSKAPYKPAFLSEVAWQLSRLIRATFGQTRKCLVLDCDSTLWGGVVGEEGLHGIRLDPNDFPGSSFYGFQRSVLSLQSQGVIVALCSKNNERDVFEVLDNHPHSLIKREHLSAWRVNWEDKPSNLKALAQELNIGLDSLVFVDDNPAECARVREFLPQVQVLQVPKSLAEYPTLLFREGCFDRLAWTGEDLKRTQLYRDEGARTQLKAAMQDTDEFLRSLEMSLDIRPVEASAVPRVAQLTQKTNQFNLTTRRYTENEISELARADDSAVFALSVRDRFGDLGLTGVLIAKRRGRTAAIDTYLLSCRILGRTIEYAFLHRSLNVLNARWSTEAWIAEFLPTAKNQQVADFWDRAGFKAVGERDAKAGARYELPEKLRRFELPAYFRVEGPT
jgi:FkbH-like protein